MIARLWRGWVRAEDREEYIDYVRRTGIDEYHSTPGNRGAHILTRELDDGRVEIITLSFWGSLNDVRGFAGDDVGVAVFYPEDDRYLVDRESVVTHYQVAD